MKRLVSVLFVALVLVVLVAAPVAAQAIDPPAPVIPEDGSLDGLLTTFLSLSGVSVLIAALVNVGKNIGIVKDGQAGKWAAGANLLVLVALYVAQVTGKAELIPIVDMQAGTVGQIVTLIAALVYQMVFTRKSHDAALAGLPLIGLSHSGRVAGDPNIVLEVAELAEDDK